MISVYYSQLEKRLQGNVACNGGKLVTFVGEVKGWGEIVCFFIMGMGGYAAFAILWTGAALCILPDWWLEGDEMAAAIS